MYLTEWSFQWLDYITRVTGRLTKSIRLLNFKEMKMSNISLENSKRDTAALGVMEDVYPQLLQTIYLCHGPAWIEIIWRILRPFIPKRVAGKIDFMSPNTR